MFSLNILTVSIDLLIAFLMLFLINKFFKLKIENHSYSMRKASFIIGFTIAITSIFTTVSSNNVWYLEILFFIIDAFMILIFLAISLKINDKLLLRGIDNNGMIKENNTSVAIVESGTTLATSIILFSSMYGEGTYLSSVVFFILGQVSLFIMISAYNLATKYNILELIKNDNQSMAIVLFSVLIGFSIVLSVNIYGDSSSQPLLQEIKYFAYSSVLYLLFLILLLNNFLDKIFFKSFSVEKEIINNNLTKIIPYSIVKLSIIIIITFAIYSNT